jgi:hypothetical protein
MSAVRGKDFKLYRNTDSPYDNSPTWVEVTNVKDLTRNIEKALADASVRGSNFRQQIGTLKELSLNFQMVYDPADAGYLQYEESFFSNTQVETLVLDGGVGTNGSRGIRFMGEVTTFTVNEALEDVGLVDVTMIVAYNSTNLARRVEISGGLVTDVA